MKVSVVLATYDGEKYISDLLNSVLNQSEKSDEVIIADDCSSDNTQRIITDFINDNRLENWLFYVNPENSGFKNNFRNAAKRATGDIVFFCDQDDIWYKEKIAQIKQKFVWNESVLAVSSAFDTVDKNGSIINSSGNNNSGLLSRKVKENEFVNIPLKEVLRSNISPGCTLAAKKEIVDKFVKNSDGFLPHDWEINLAAAAQNGLYFYNTPLVGYRIHENNALGFKGESKNRVDIARQKAKAVEQLAKYLDVTPLLNLTKKRLEFLENFDFFGVFSLNFKKIYRQFYSFKERMGDIKFALTGDKK